MANVFRSPDYERERERERERESHSPRTADKQMGSCKLGITSLLRSEKEEE